MAFSLSLAPTPTAAAATLGQIMDHNFSLSNKKQFSQMLYRFPVIGTAMQRGKVFQK